MEKKITMATVKSFIRKNIDSLYINVKSEFDGMTDCCEDQHGGFRIARRTDKMALLHHNLGIAELWLVGSSRDRFNTYDDGEYTGIEYYNSCGYGVLAVRKAA